MDKPGYNAFIPSYVRYDDELPFGARLIFGELSALANAQGFCWASNKYFADLYDVSISTISEWIGLLADRQYIFLEVEQNYKRKIYITDPQILNSFKSLRKIPKGVPENPEAPPTRKAEDNNTSINNKKNVSSDEEIPPSEENEIQSFEDYALQERGWRQDSNVDSDGHVSTWWEDQDGVRVPKREVTALHGAYKRLQGVSGGRPQPPKDEPTTRFLEFYKKQVKERYGREPVTDAKTKHILKKGLIDKYDKEQINEFVRWFLENEKIEKKWKFSIESLTSTKFMNEFLAQ